MLFSPKVQVFYPHSYLFLCLDGTGNVELKKIAGYITCDSQCKSTCCSTLCTYKQQLMAILSIRLYLNINWLTHWLWDPFGHSHHFCLFTAAGAAALEFV